jgi:polyhydroxyalkanoate synthase
MTTTTKTHQDVTDDLDRVVHARIAQLTRGLSPETIVGSYLDWLIHLAASPGKQQRLIEKALEQWSRLALWAMSPAARAGAPCIEPLPQDRRFREPSWQQWPFNVIYQAFLLQQQWWHNATTGVRGVDRHHEQVATFVTRQLLDMVSPSNLLWTNPEALDKTARSGGTNLLQGARNWWEDAMRLVSNQPPVGADAFAPGRNVAVTPGKVVFRNRLIELIQYAPASETVFAAPVLIVPSWIMKYYILDLSPSNSLVKYLVDHGHTVFIVSWKNPDASDRDLGMDDYLRSGVQAAIDAVATIVPQRRIQAVGYCLGGTLLAIAAAAMARADDTRLNTLTLLATEVDFEQPGELSLFIDESQLTYLEDMMWEKGYLDGKQMAGAFALLNSRDLIWSRIVHDYVMGTRQPMTDLMAWNADATRMPYRQHSEYLRSLYLNNDLADGHYLVHGRPIALTDIRAPIFSVATQRDHVSPWRSVYKVHLLTDTQVTFCLTSGGHNVGVVSPPGPGVPRSYQLTTRASEDKYIDPDTWLTTTPSHEGSWWPTWESWLREHAGERVAPPAFHVPDSPYAPIADAPGQYVLMP